MLTMFQVLHRMWPEAMDGNGRLTVFQTPESCDDAEATVLRLGFLSMQLHALRVPDELSPHVSDK